MAPHIKEEWWHGCISGRAVSLKYPDVQPLMLLRQPDDAPPLTFQVQSVATKDFGLETFDNRVLLDLKWGNTRTGLGGLQATVDAGQTVVVCGSVLEVVARTVGEGPGKADLRLMVTEGWKGNPLPVTYTAEGILTDAAGIAQWWAVPPFATTCGLLFDLVPDASTQLNVIMAWCADKNPIGPRTVAYQFNQSWNQPFPGPLPILVPREALWLRVSAVTFPAMPPPVPIVGMRIQPVWNLAI